MGITTLLARFVLIFLLTSTAVKAGTPYFIDVYDSYNSPPDQAIHTGDTVTWTCYDDFFPHTVTSDNNSWNNVILYPGDAVTLPFNSVGTYGYHDNGSGAYGTITVTAPVNALPSVTITNPVSGTTFNAPATFAVQASASDTDGTIANVQFFVGATSLGTDSVSPYSANVTSLAAGTYTLKAVATDNAGGKGTNTVSITVNSSPSVTITNPTAGTVFLSPATFAIQASASDSDGTVTNVQFLLGATSLTNAKTAPFAATASNVVAGNYTLYAIASDNLGAKATNSVAIVVNAAPSVAITSPGSGSVFKAPYTNAVQATSSDSDGTITRVDFYKKLDTAASATLAGTVSVAPYNLAMNLPAGNYVLTATAVDNRGASNSANVSIAVITNSTMTSFQSTNTGSVLKFATIRNQSYIVEANTNLANAASWVSISTNTGDATGTVTVTDNAATNLTKRFYRIKSQ